MDNIIVPASKKILITLLGTYLIFMFALSFNVFDRATWFVENLTVWILVTILGFLWWRGVRLSLGAYLLTAVLVFMHTLGGHYTFAHVPFDWFTNNFGFERNHYDRIAHFSVGFWAFAIAEWMLIKHVTRSYFVLLSYPILAIATVAMTYELIEMAFAIVQGGDSASADLYLGSQGDIWDAQRDMLADTLGAITAMLIFAFVYPMARIKKFLN